MAHTVKVLPAAASCWDEDMSPGRDEPVCILLRHLRDTKRQETRLRLLTMLLLLGCSALYIFSLCAELRRRDHQSSGEQRAAETLPEKQQAAVSSTGKKRFNIHLGSKHMENRTDGQHIQWEEIFLSKPHYDPERKAIVIPEDGIYYIYIRTQLKLPLTLRCVDGTALFNKFYMELSNWSETYPESQVLTWAMDGISCPHQEFRTVSVGGQFHLLEGDRVSVRIGDGYELLYESTFGAFLVSAQAL